MSIWQWRLPYPAGSQNCKRYPGGTSMNNFSRRQILLAAGSTLVASPFIMRRPAMAAEFSYKYANNSASYRMNIRAKEAADKIREETGGRFELSIFPSSQLGSDTDTLSQLRSGAVEFFTLSGLFFRPSCPPRQSTVSVLPFPIVQRSGRPWTVNLAPMCVRRSRSPISLPWTKSGTMVSAISHQAQSQL